MRSLWVVLYAVVLVGCSSEPEGLLQGKVLLEGEPLPNVGIVFTYPDGKKLDARPTRKDGVYELRMVPSGTVKVHFVAKAGVTPAQLKTKSGKTLPAKYLSPTDSDLVATITGSKQQLDFSLPK
jgi:uncharacterized protein YcfL